MIVIKNGLLIDPAAGREGEFDLLVEGSEVREVATPGAFGAIRDADTIDASGCWVTPGLIDIHVHLREPGFEWKETVRSGSEAAVLGGFTSVCCMANTSPVNDNAEITNFIREQARQAGLARVFPIGAVTKGLKGKEMAPFSELRRAGCVAVSDDGEPVYDAGVMRRALEWCGMFDMPVLCHEEDKSLCHGGCMNESPLSVRLGLHGMPRVAEDIMVARDIELARLTSSRVHFCHISSGRSVELIRRAKNDGIRVTAEATPHHLALNEERVGRYDTDAKMSPPLRLEDDRLELCRGLADGTIDAIASDHAPHERDRKEVEFDKAAFGILGLQTTVPLILGLVRSGVLSRRRAVEALTISPANCIGLRGLGSLAKGSPADLTLIAPDKEWTLSRENLRSLSKNSPWLGTQLVGRVETVIVDGKQVVAQGQLEGQ